MAGSEQLLLPQRLREHAAATPEACAFTFLADGDRHSESLSFAALDCRAREVAACLQQGAAPGDRVLLACPPGLEYIAAFLGCLYAGMVAVPCPSPAGSGKLARLAAIVADAAPRVAVAPQEVIAGLEALFERDGASRHCVCVSLQALGAPAKAWVPVAPDPDSLAFLQYTSGSTGDPKGVMVAHANIMANLAAMQDKVRLQPSDVGLSWLPPHHAWG